VTDTVFVVLMWLTALALIVIVLFKVKFLFR